MASATQWTVFKQTLGDSGRDRENTGMLQVHGVTEQDTAGAALNNHKYTTYFKDACVLSEVLKASSFSVSSSTPV